MRIWSILLVKFNAKWCIHFSRILFLYDITYRDLYILVEFSICMTLLIVISKLRITKWLNFYFYNGEGDNMFNFDIRLPVS